MKINYIHNNEYRDYATEVLQEQIIFLEETIQTEVDPRVNQIARTHKFLAEVALFERIL